MGRLEKFKENEDKLIKLISSEQVSEEDLDFLYSLLIDETKSNRTKYEIWSLLRKRQDLLNFEKLAKILKINPLNIKYIFKSKPKVVYFPLALGDKAYLSKAYIVNLPKNSTLLSFSQAEDIKQGLETVKILIKNFDEDKRNFFVIFEDDFTGKSFMLSVVAGLLLPEEILNKYAFTGVLNEEGEVFEIEYISTKENLAKEKNLKLVSPDLIDTIDELIYWLGEDSVDLPLAVIIGKNKGEIENSLKKLESSIKEKNKHFSINGLKNFFDIEKEDLVVYTSQFLPALEEEDLKKDNPWKDFIGLYENKLEKLYEKTRLKTKVLHIVFAGPASLAMAMGTRLGTKKPVILYHYQADRYIPVINLSTIENLRKIKYVRKLSFKNFKTIDVNYMDKDLENLAVSIWLASHNLFSDVRKYMENKNIKANLLEIESKDFQGDIPLPKEFDFLDENYWTVIVSEIYSVINIIRNNSYINEVNFFLSVPVAIAFALGMSIGHFWRGYIYNYFPKEDEKYKKVFSINDRGVKF